MNRIFFQLALPIIALANITPAIATTNYQNIDLSQRQSNYQTRSPGIEIAGFFDELKDSVDNATDTVEDVDQTRRGVEERDLEMQERKAQQEDRKRAQEESEAARRHSTERQHQEADRRIQYFQSLSPEEQEAYIDKQLALEQQQEEASIIFLDAVLGGQSTSDGSGSSLEGQKYD